MKFSTYEDWQSDARDRDERAGAVRWQKEEESSRYDYRTIRLRLGASESCGNRSANFLLLSASAPHPHVRPDHARRIASLRRLRIS